MISGSLDKDFLNFSSLVTVFDLLKNPQLNDNKTKGLFRGGFRKGCAKRTVCAKNPLNPYPRTLEKISKTRDRHRVRIPEKEALHHFSYVPMLRNCFPGKRAR